MPLNKITSKQEPEMLQNYYLLIYFHILQILDKTND